MKSLDELAIKYGTDKSSQAHNYTQFYQFWIDAIKPKKLLEVGLGNGASARTWREYLPDAKIYIMEFFGEENQQKWNKANGVIDGVAIISGDSTKEETWLSVPNDIDVLVEDGSHKPEDQIQTFLLGFPKLCSGGFYFLEDTHTSFDPAYGGKNIYHWVLNLVYEQQLPLGLSEGNFDFYRQFMPEIVRDIRSYHFYKSCIIFEKA